MSERSIDAASPYEEFARRFDGIANRNHSRIKHMEAEFSHATEHAANVFYRDANAGLFPDFNGIRDAILAADAQRQGEKRNESETKLWLWNNAIASWLAVRFPNRISKADSGVNFMHSAIKRDARPVLTYYTPAEIKRLTPEALEWAKGMTATVRKQYRIKMRAGAIVKHFKIPDSAVIQDESRYGEIYGDEPDMMRRLRHRAEVAAVACRVIHELLVEKQVASASAGVRRRGKRDMMEKLVDAMLAVGDNPELSDSEIARRVGCSKSYLSKNVIYKKAASLARDCGTPARKIRGPAGGPIEVSE